MIKSNHRLLIKTKSRYQWSTCFAPDYSATVLLLKCELTPMSILSKLDFYAKILENLCLNCTTLLALTTLGNLTQIWLFVLMSCYHPWWPRQVEGLWAQSHMFWPKNLPIEMRVYTKVLKHVMEGYWQPVSDCKSVRWYFTLKYNQ